MERDRRRQRESGYRDRATTAVNPPTSATNSVAAVGPERRTQNAFVGCEGLLTAQQLRRWNGIPVPLPCREPCTRTAGHSALLAPSLPLEHGGLFSGRWFEPHRSVWTWTVRCDDGVLNAADGLYYVAGGGGGWWIGTAAVGRGRGGLGGGGTGASRSTTGNQSTAYPTSGVANTGSEPWSTCATG